MKSRFLPKKKEQVFRPAKRKRRQSAALALRARPRRRRKGPSCGLAVSLLYRGSPPVQQFPRPIRGGGSSSYLQQRRDTNECLHRHLAAISSSNPNPQSCEKPQKSKNAGTKSKSFRTLSFAFSAPCSP